MSLEVDSDGLVASDVIISPGTDLVAVMQVNNEIGTIQPVAALAEAAHAAGALFLCVGVLYDRVHSREISSYGGVINAMPKFAALMVLFGLANAGLPGTSGFVGEFFVILGTFHANPWLAFLAATTLITGAAYTLWMIKRVVFGEVANSHVAALTDVSPREFWMLMVLAVAVLVVGIWPAPIVDRMDASIGQLLMHVGQPKL